MQPTKMTIAGKSVPVKVSSRAGTPAQSYNATVMNQPTMVTCGSRDANADSSNPYHNNNRLFPTMFLDQGKMIGSSFTLTTLQRLIKHQKENSSLLERAERHLW